MRRPLSERQNFGPTLAFGPSDLSTQQPTFSALSTDLPDNVKLQTLTSNYASLHGGKLLFRLAHLYSIGEHPTLSQPAQVDLSTLFGSGYRIKDAQEMSAAASMTRAEMEKSKYDWKTDGEDCGRYGSDNVTITTGPFAGGVAQGQCGRCDGIVGVDTLGVLEFDTSTDTFVGQHVMPDGAGGDPFGSPDGRHIVLVGRNGGEVIRILSAGKPGEESTVAFDLALGFSTLDEETSAVYSDFAFIQTSASDGMGDGIDRDMIIIASGTENKVAIVDVSTGSPQITIVTMRDDTELTARRNRRQVEWVVGTQYVWIDGTNQEEIYVLDIASKQVIRTVKGVPTTKMLSVENFAAKRTNDLIAQRISAAISDFVPDMMGTDQDTDKSEDKDKDEDTSYNVKSEISALSESTDDDNDIDPVGIAALVVGLCALIVGVANMIYMSRSTTSDSGGNNEGGDSVDQKTLGSKNIA